MKYVIRVLIPLLLIAGGIAWYSQGSTDTSTGSFRFTTIERGNVESVVSSTGTLEPVMTVAVGTQVSGIVSDIYVDFNDEVRQGQIVARLDTTLLGIAVRDARASLERSMAQLRQTRREYDRLTTLRERDMVAESDYDQAVYQYEVARAAVTSANINMERAERNLSYATIRAPISGTVIERNVDKGQTVAASLSAPQILLLANDLREMHIMASVDESDIGQIHEGQQARFTVQAYSDDSFMGTVRQVRLQSTTQENVVNYTVVISVSNPDGRLLPGMTATVDFIVQTASDVLKVANSALRFTPSTEMMEQIRAQRMAATGGQRPQFAGRNGQGGQSEGSARGERSSASRANRSRVFFVDSTGTPSMVPVRTGITDGQYTEISGPRLAEGMQVIIGTTSGTAAATASSNPFQSTQSSRRRGPGGPPF